MYQFRKNNQSRGFHKSYDNKIQSLQFKDDRDTKIKSEQIQDSPRLVTQRKQTESFNNQPIQKKENKTGLPDHLKSGIENLSGYSMDDVRVHYNSSQPAQLQAHAYAQGNQIHLASGQEKHLAHEAWHVVQQKQGRVQPTKQLKSKVNINDDAGLEREADIMGTKALQSQPIKTSTQLKEGNTADTTQQHQPIQRIIIRLANTNERLGENYFQQNRRFKDEQIIPTHTGNQQHQMIHPAAHTIEPRKGKFGITINPTELQKDVQRKLEGTDFSHVGLDEPVVFMGHGITDDKKIKHSNLKAQVALGQQGYNASDFYKALTDNNKGLPKGYRGTIYLQGCFTGVTASRSFKDSLAGSLFIKLQGQFPLIIVKGNLSESKSKNAGLVIDDDDNDSNEIHRMQQDFKNVYQKSMNMYTKINVMISSLEDAKPEIPDFSEQSKLDQAIQTFESIKTSINALAKNYGHIVLFGEEPKENDATEQEVAAKSKSLSLQRDKAAELVKSLQEAKQLEINQFKQGNTYQEWKQEKDHLENLPLYKMMPKVLTDLDLGIVNFYNENQWIKDSKI